jgi:hypothetical protein
LPAGIGGWQMYQDVKIDQDTLNRVYLSRERNASAFLFVAFFKTQRYGQAPHSPKNCPAGKRLRANRVRADYGGGSGPGRAGPDQPVSYGAR